MSPLTAQVQASLEEQNFTEVWGKKAKELYGNIWSNFSDLQLRKIIGSIQTLGPSNLPLEKREQVGEVLAEPWPWLGAAKCLKGIFPNNLLLTHCPSIAFWGCLSLAFAQGRW